MNLGSLRSRRPSTYLTRNKLKLKSGLSEVNATGPEMDTYQMTAEAQPKSNKTRRVGDAAGYCLNRKRGYHDS